MRANRSVCMTIVIVGAFPILLYLGQILQGILSIRRAVIIALLIEVPILFSIIYYVKCPLSLRYRHWAVIAFYVVFEVSCLSSDLFLYNIFIFPVMIAGDAGRGFAVVAEEIRKLSEQTKASTEDIQQIIEKLNENAGDSMESLDTVMKEMDEQISMIHEIKNNFADIKDGIGNLKTDVEDMNGKTVSLRKNNEVIIDNNSNISSASEEISAASEETTAMCTQNSERFRDVNRVVEELAAEAERMGRYIDEYTRLHRAETAVDDGSKKRGDNKSDGKINNLVTGVAS